MVFKLKLKVPSSNGNEASGKQSKSSKTSKSSKSTSSSSSASVSGPKLKLKLPDQSSSTPSATPSSSGIPKIKIKNSSISKPKSKSGSASSPKKLKISLVRKDGGNGNVKLKLPLKKPSSGNDEAVKTATAGNTHMPDIIKPVKSVPKVRIKPTRVPGDGYDSEAPDVEDDPLLEQGIVVRFLDDVNLDLVHNAVDSGDLSDVNIKWITKDKAIVNVKATLYSARLIDLPTLTEIYKTIDKKNIYKTLDVCQILLVLRTIDPTDLNMEKDFELDQSKLHVHPIYKMPTSELKPTKNVYRDGLTYPYEDVYRRFRPRKLDHRVIEDIQAKVDELIKLDNEAEEIHFEVIDNKKHHQPAEARHHGYDLSNMSTPGQDRTASPSPFVEAGKPREGTGEPEEAAGPADIEDPDLEEELAKALEGEDGDDMEVDEEGEEIELDVDEADVGDGEIELEVDNEGVEDDEIEGEVDNGEGDDDEEDDDEDDDDDDDDDDDEDEEEEVGEDSGAKAEKQHARMLEEEIADLEKVVEKHRVALEAATHKMMKMKFQTSYRTLKASLDSKKSELAKIVNDQQQKRSNDGSGKPGGNEEDEGDEDDEDDDDDEEEEEDGDGDGDGDGDEEDQEEENDNENANENENKNIQNIDDDDDNAASDQDDDQDNIDDIDDLF